LKFISKNLEFTYILKEILVSVTPKGTVSSRIDPYAPMACSGSDDRLSNPTA
jgi:hypothetical protein